MATGVLDVVLLETLIGLDFDPDEVISLPFEGRLELLRAASAEGRIEPEEAERLRGLGLLPAEPRYPCPCCGHLVFREGPGSYDICPVCFWEDDLVQLRWPDWPGGANKPSLIEAQGNFSKGGSSEARLLEHVRAPASEEPLDDGWRPVNPALDDFEAITTQEAEWPDDRTVLYYWRPGFWRASHTARKPRSEPAA